MKKADHQSVPHNALGDDSRKQVVGVEGIYGPDDHETQYDG
jgi:hypothetical protein